VTGTIVRSCADAKPAETRRLNAKARDFSPAQSLR
jgi:hypothetical protein